MSGRDFKVHYTWIHRVSQHVHIHSWKFRRPKNYAAATIMENTMVTVHKSDKTCSVCLVLPFFFAENKNKKNNEK